ncbi:MAG: hypothetical protein U0271_17145 [Polyangiaceae bacterium]
MGRNASLWVARALLGGALTLGVASASPRAALADGVSVKDATPEQKTKAQELFTAALDKIKANDHAGALDGLRASFEVVASPNTRLLITRELIALGRLAEAYREFIATERIAREAGDPKYDATAQTAVDERKALEPKLGFITIDLGGRAGELSVGGRAVSGAEAAQPIAVDPGDVTVTFTPTGGAAETQTISVGAGAQASASFAKAEPPKKTESGGSMHPFDMGTGQLITGSVFAGVGVVGFILFAGLGAQSASIYSDLEDQCPNNRCPAGLASDADEGKSLQLGANVSVALGAIFLAGGAAMIIPTFFAGGDKKDEPTKAASITVVGAPLPGGGVVAASGRF